MAKRNVRKCSLGRRRCHNPASSFTFTLAPLPCVSSDNVRCVCTLCRHVSLRRACCTQTCCWQFSPSSHSRSRRRRWCRNCSRSRSNSVCRLIHLLNLVKHSALSLHLSVYHRANTTQNTTTTTTLPSPIHTHTHSLSLSVFFKSHTHSFIHTP